MKNKKVIILINGVARSGKDTFAEYLQKHLSENTDNRSTIQPNACGVKNVASKVYGWNGEKDEKGRKLLIDITNTGYSYDPVFWEKYAVEHLRRFEHMWNTFFNYVIVPDFRYKNTYDFYTKKGYKVFAIHITRPNHDNKLGELKNDVSELPLDVPFKYNVLNNGSLEQLEEQAKIVASHIIKGELL